MLINQHPSAISAFHSRENLGDNNQDRKAIMELIERSNLDWTIAELSEALHMAKSSVSGRVNELLEANKLVALPRRPDRVSRNRRGAVMNNRPVALPGYQKGLFQ